MINFEYEQGLDIWLPVLQDEQLRVLPDCVPQCLHPPGHQCGQKKGEKVNHYFNEENPR